MEIHTFVDQRQASIDLFFVEHSARLVRQGTIVATFRQRGGRRLGPYYRLTCRDREQRQVSVYLGPAGPVVVTTRQRLEQLQQRHQQQQFWMQTRREVHQKLKAAREQLTVALAQHGLRTQGVEIRGWRQIG